MSGQGQSGGMFASRPRPGRIATYLALFVLGVLVGTAGSLVQGGWVPGGLLLALLATAGLFFGGLYLTGTQLGVGAPAAAGCSRPSSSAWAAPRVTRSSPQASDRSSICWAACWWL